MTSAVTSSFNRSYSDQQEAISSTIYHLPTVSSGRMHTFIKERALQESNSSDVLEKYHPHSLVLIDDIADQESVCNACIQPVSPPYYSCNKYCNGFGYSYSEYYSSVDDIECSSAPTVIKHDSHKGHPLILTDTDLFSSWLACCGKKCIYSYLCAICKFKIHIGCALRPKSVTHKFDKHPLFLTFPSSSQGQKDSSDIDHLFCEFCEEDIDSKYWFYHCAECDQSFHVDCIPSQGIYSKIKFGGTVKLHCHDHPLTLVRTLTIGSQTCGYCDDIIQGFKDAMALHCEDCDFWIHYKCGIRSWGSRPSHPYLDLRWLKFD
ncbi:hypothetical protein F511_27610 [Dorcoceras hygrometricum]|uniref:Phorbol-ester/DAG-type domain-containing protein n=1 Tax=Dorcoceras hygrometricum TaxID=472368 RepID=A0A2Z7AHM9_9LAMI|nr:hypothetical protein F511_27610 [Dorcoceras hygrometricum]